MKDCRSYKRFKNTPDSGGHIFRSGYQAFQPRHVFVEVAMVDGVKYMFPNDPIQPRKIRDHSRHRINIATHANLKIVVVAVVGLPGTWSEEMKVFLFSKPGHIEPQRAAEGQAGTDQKAMVKRGIDHGHATPYLIESGSFLGLWRER